MARGEILSIEIVINRAHNDKKWHLYENVAATVYEYRTATEIKYEIQLNDSVISARSAILRMQSHTAL
jgi:hypothetical protein